MRLKLYPRIIDGNVEVGVMMNPKDDSDDDGWDLGQLVFTLDEWTEFVVHFSNNPTEIGFDSYDADGERVIL